jgi:NAD(P)-dependent dehydrogenase (short-subunit alcohol dehydrogenase family)
MSREQSEVPSRSAGPVFDLSGKVAVVTGGSRGLGAEIVRGFAAAGAEVVIVSRKLAACEALAREVTAAFERPAFAVACHVGRWNDTESLYERLYDQFDAIDVLVNNAGMSPLYGSIADVDEELFDKVIGVNFKGPFRLSALVGTRMVADGGGSIINVSSGGSLRPRPHIVPYAAAKAALNAMTVGLAHTFGPTVRVNCIVPGPFRTDVAASWDMPAVEARQQGYALRRIGEPAEVVGAALYFASDASSFTTGALLQVDGGMP